MQTEKKKIHIDVLKRDVEVRELSVNDMRTLIRARDHIEEDFDYIVMLMSGDGVLLSDLLYLTDLEQKELGMLTENQIDMILSVSKGLNPRFFAQILKALGSMAEIISKTPELFPKLLESSNETSSSLSEPDTQTPGPTH